MRTTQQLKITVRISDAEVPEHIREAGINALLRCFAARARAEAAQRVEQEEMMNDEQRKDANPDIQHA